MTICSTHLHSTTLSLPLPHPFRILGVIGHLATTLHSALSLPTMQHDYFPNYFTLCFSYQPPFKISLLFSRLSPIDGNSHRYLLNHMKFLDKARVGVWGWGFGGYVSAMILGSNKKVFKCGVAVSPITDWIYYSELFFYTSF